jgi:NAD-dependent SIR2 family protein deacetylase
MEKLQCSKCGQSFSEEEGFFVYENDESYFLCDGCGHASQPASQEDIQVFPNPEKD